MNIKKSILLEGKHGKPIATDFHYNEKMTNAPVVILCHGYKGFKDWGVFEKMATDFIAKGLVLVRFNFSHNGTIPKKPTEFVDLDAFGKNNYTKELGDLQVVIECLHQQDFLNPHINTDKIYLLGHSRGAGICILKTSQYHKIKKLATWAAPCDFRGRFPKGAALKQWEKDGIAYIENSRTGQMMPHKFQFYKDFVANENHQDIQAAAKKIAIPHLIVHGDKDDIIPLAEAKILHKWSQNSILEIIKDSNHTFEVTHPFLENSYPTNFKLVLKKTLQFFAKS